MLYMLTIMCVCVNERVRENRDNLTRPSPPDSDCRIHRTTYNVNTNNNIRYDNIWISS